MGRNKLLLLNWISDQGGKGITKNMIDEHYREMHDLPSDTEVDILNALMRQGLIRRRKGKLKYGRMKQACRYVLSARARRLLKRTPLQFVARREIGTHYE